MDYITCNRIKSKYRIGVVICETCKWMKNCPDYQAHRQPSLFPEGLKRKRITKVMYRRGGKPRRVESEPTENTDKPEQLSLNF